MHIPGRFKRDAFFEKLNALGVAVTFNDVRLKLGYSEVAPADVSLKSWCSKNIELNVPVLSSAMDTVTEWQLAVAMSEEGGMGVIHKGRGMTIENQVLHVTRVKNHRHTKIGSPVTVNENSTVGQVLALKVEHSYDFHSFPVVNDDGILVGLMTRHHFELNTQENLVIKDVMTPREKVVTSTPKTSVTEAAAIMRAEEKGVLPLIDKDGKVTGMYVSADIERLIKTSNIYNLDKNGHLRVGAAIGAGEHEIERAIALIEAGADAIVIDTAHGHSKNVIETLVRLVSLYPHMDFIVGNVAEPEAAEALAKAGATGIKVGVGPGSICTTRIVAGVGNPQVTAVHECSKAVRGSGVIIIADGGIVHEGDIPIILAAGAHCVMIGKRLAGTNESPGEVKKTSKGNYKVYRGMGSADAMKDSAAARERYRQSGDTPVSKLVPEGVTSIVPLEGSVADVIFKLMGGLRAGMGYVGAATIAELHEKADFRRISSAGWQESQPHDVIILDPSSS